MLADRVGIIDHGKIVAEGTPGQLKAEIGSPTRRGHPRRPDRGRSDSAELLAGSAPRPAAGAAPSPCSSPAARPSSPTSSAPSTTPTSRSRRCSCTSPRSTTCSWPRPGASSRAPVTTPVDGEPTAPAAQDGGAVAAETLRRDAPRRGGDRGGEPARAGRRGGTPLGHPHAAPARAAGVPADLSAYAVRHQRQRAERRDPSRASRPTATAPSPSRCRSSRARCSSPIAAGTDLARDIETGFFNRLALTPLRGTALLIGQLGGAFVVACIQSVVYLLVGLAMGVGSSAGSAARWCCSRCRC